jgi:2-amino-4-hydroxy-6-hydroxymethyldihydropteridine diphosphokinase
MTQTYIGIGSNLGTPADNVLQAIRELQSIGKLLAHSGLYLTKPWGYTDQPDFVNAVVSLEVDCSASELLNSLLQIEREMGRERLIKWGPRTIDLDILLFGDLQIDEPSLTVPHPEMYKRAFVLIPLAEIDSRFASFVHDLPEQTLIEVTVIQDLYFQDIDSTVLIP